MNTPAGSDDALGTLKQLLLGEEQQQIEAISERLADPSLRSEDVAEVLPDAVRLRDARDDELTDALEPPVTQCIERSIRRDPDNFANALYPVMGPAIRQSITSTLRGLVENINRTLEHSLSIQGLKWRIEALRTGVPFAEIVLRHTLAYRVEQVFLIQPGSGLLMQHVQDELAGQADADAISGMLTAITQFVRDAFQADEKEGLDTVEMGEHTVLLVHGPQAYLAAVVRGILPSELREHCQEVLESLHARYRSQLEQFDGRTETLAPAAPLLGRCLRSQHKSVEKKRGLSPAFILILLGLAMLAAWWGYRLWQAHRAQQDWQAREHRLVALLDAQPGLTLTDVIYGRQRLRLRGLRDPQAAPVEPLLKQAGIEPGRVDMQWRPYLDLDPRLVEQRARKTLAPPEGVSLSLRQGILRLSGHAPADWLRRARLQAPLIPGVQGLDEQGLQSLDDYLLEQARTRLAPPQGVEMRVEQQRLAVRGSAPLAWIEGLDQAAAAIPGLQGVDRQGLVPTESLEFEQLRIRIENTNIYFTERSELDQNQQQQLARLGEVLKQLYHLGQRLHTPFHVLLIGHTDGIGLPELNTQIGLTRALLVRDTLVSQGLPAELFRWQAEIGQTPIQDVSARRTEFRIILDQGQ